MDMAQAELEFLSVLGTRGQNHFNALRFWPVGDLTSTMSMRTASERCHETLILIVLLFLCFITRQHHFFRLKQPWGKTPKRILVGPMRIYLP
jgi:hypothetical protein